MVFIRSRSFALSVLDGLVGIFGNLFHAHARAGSDPWKSGKQGRFTLIYRVISKCTEAGLGSTFTPASISQLLLE